MKKQIRANLKSKLVTVHNYSRQYFPPSLTFSRLCTYSALVYCIGFFIHPTQQQQQRNNTKLEKGKEGKFLLQQLKLKYN